MPPVDLAWVVVEEAGRRPATSGLELITRARELGRRVEAFTCGDAGRLAGDVGRHGAVRVYGVGGSQGMMAGPALAAAMAARIAAGDRPEIVLCPSTYDGCDAIGRLSARIDRPVLANVVELVPGAPPAAVQAVFGGATTVTARFTGGPPWLYLIRPGSFEGEAVRGPAAEVVQMEPDPGPAGAARVVDRHFERGDGPRLDEAAVVVAGGRGVGGAAGFRMVEELARLLNGAAGATGAAVDAGWAPFARQVGQTGQTVKPMLYIACGISGASQHLIGMKGARHVVAINDDPEAAIFSVADLGVVGDVNRVLPRLIDSIRAARG